MYNGISQTPLLVFSNIVVITTLFLFLRPVMIYPYRVSIGKFRFCLLLNFAFCLFSFWGLDWFGYLRTYENVKIGNNTNLEEIYIFIIENFCHDYLFFRTIVWGVALIFLFDTIRRLSISNHLFLFIFSISYLIYFSYARVSLAMAVMFYGLSLFYRPYKNIRVFSFLLAGASIYASLYLHKSALFGVAILIISLLTMRINRKRLLFLIVILFPVLINLGRDYLVEIMEMEVSDEYGFGNVIYAGQRYFLHEGNVAGLGKKVSVFMESLPYFLIAYLSVRFNLSKRYKLVPKDIKVFIRVFFLLVISSLVFLFDLGYNTDVVYIRFLRYNLIPASIVLTFFYQERYMPKLTRSIMLLLGANVAYSLLYTFYNVCLQ